MNETRTCQNCKQEFTIAPEDFEFYKKIAVPPPTRCPDCRAQRRYSWRNERVLYRRSCDLCQKTIVTIYSPNKPFKVYCTDCFWSDKWTALDYGREFDFSRPFFEQFRALQLQVPRIALLSKNSTNSDYTNHSNSNKDCYLCFSTFDSENLLYCTNMWKTSRDCVDMYLAKEGAERCYEGIDVSRGYQCQYGILLNNCNNCSYCYDCRGCSDCFLSYNLRNKQYHILNKPYSKEEYEKKIKEYNFGSDVARRKLYDQFLELLQTKAIQRFAIIERSENCSGNQITDSKNAHHMFDADKVEDTKYSVICLDAKDSMDAYHYGFECELIYESHALIHCYNVQFTHLSYHNSHLQYCDSCHNSENLFGCVGIKKGKFCIFNRQYEEEEYKKLCNEIIAHMKQTGEYGEFFPAEFSPFGYNETQGQIYMPLPKERVVTYGWQWEERVPGTFGKETLKPEQLPDHISEVPDTVINEVLACGQCGKNYTILKSELTFYRQEQIPIPRACPECRYRKRIELRAPRKLWRRECMCEQSGHGWHTGRCPNEFDTPYAPERPGLVYCGECYNAEVI